MSESTWSVPETEVLQRIHDRLDAAETDVLATIVEVEGNAYRRPGAKMLLDEEGMGIGSITAGCLENELVKASDDVRESGRPELITYDLTGDDDVWGLGVGCDGIIHVLLEPLTETYRPAVGAFAEGRDVAVLTVLEDDGPLARGDRAYVSRADGELFLPATGGDVDAWPADNLVSPATKLAERGRSDVLGLEVDGRSLQVFVDGLAAPEELLVFGTGHDVGPVVELAGKSDFRVTVVGFRGGVDLADRFAGADRTVTTSPGTLGEDLTISGDTHAVVMTHNFIEDRLTVEALLNSPCPYIGLMGPHDRFQEMVEAFEEEGRTLDESDLERIYTPVGLDLGGGSPYQIAHSVVAELLAVANDRDPKHLRDREGNIHERVELDTESADDAQDDPGTDDTEATPADTD
ncbi:xanthine dehydrogenase [Halobacteriales archaeon SW_7_65_23]|nr:MAG: xanthine dehydrogenase [Halobacteriales archaeon SW_7_65_23]